MASLTLIAEPFPDWEASVQVAAARDLVQAVADTAPRSCSAKFLVARGSEAPKFRSPKISTEQLPLRAGLLPMLWQSGTTARPLDGEFVHALTPMVPLRSRGDDDGSQNSVTVPHTLAWENPELLGKSQARLYRNFVRRAVRFADVLITSTHATARVLQENYGVDLPVQVLQLAPPSEFLPGDDAAERRTALALPETYTLTTAMPGDAGRLEWLFDALRLDPSLPPLVVLEGLDPVAAAHDATASAVDVPEELQHRVQVVRARELDDVGAVIAGAAVIAAPQTFCGTGYLFLAALASGVAVLHAANDAVSEMVLDGGVSADDAGSFAAELTRLHRDHASRDQLAVLAADRGRGFSWHSAAWQLWETHANL